MRKTTAVVAAVTLVLGVALGCLFGPARPAAEANPNLQPARVQWEYLAVPRDELLSTEMPAADKEGRAKNAAAATARLNKLGADGWEFVAFDLSRDGVFKRPKK